jgi:D-alanyl-D-alanine carboxypeptidase
MTHARRVLAGVAAGALVAATITVAPAAADHGSGRGVDTAAVQRQLDLLTTVDRMPGALATVRDRRGRTVTLTSGTAELGTGRPMVGSHARFRIASVTKPFVATAVLQLVARGTVRLDEPIDTYLPGVVRGSGEGAEIDGREITVRQLLQHTSGIPDYVEYLDKSDPTGPPVTPEQLLGLALAHKPGFRPGTGWSYSNTGYIIAGLLVERITGRDVATVVTERVIRPAGLRDTYWPAPGDVRIHGRHARNYTQHPDDPTGPLVDVTEFEPSFAGASGTLISTPSDLDRFWRALFTGRLLPRWAVAEMRDTVPLPPDWQELVGEDAGYGLGLMRVPLSCGGFAWGHGGDLVGVSNVSARDDRGPTVTVYRTAQVDSPQPAQRTAETVDIALCSGRS